MKVTRGLIRGHVADHVLDNVRRSWRGSKSPAETIALQVGPLICYAIRTEVAIYHLRTAVYHATLFGTKNVVGLSCIMLRSPVLSWAYGRNKFAAWEAMVPQPTCCCLARRQQVPRPFSLGTTDYQHIPSSTQVTPLFCDHLSLLLVLLCMQRFSSLSSRRMVAGSSSVRSACSTARAVSYGVHGTAPAYGRTFIQCVVLPLTMPYGFRQSVGEIADQKREESGDCEEENRGGGQNTSTPL